MRRESSLDIAETLIEFSGFDLIGLGQDNLITCRRPVERLEHIVIDVFQPCRASIST